MKKNKYCLTHNKFIRLRNLVVQFVRLVDDEMEHGDYHAPDITPFRFDEEGSDYLKNHNAIIKNVTSVRKDIGKLINHPFL